MSVDFRPKFLDTDDPDWFFDSGEVPMLNVSNVNADFLLSYLGQVSAERGLSRDPFRCDDLAGDMDGQAFQGAIEIAIVMAPTDEGLPAYTNRNVVDCGRRAGYLQDKLGQLIKIADWAVQNGRRVEWC